jgi:hypothetical protein
MRLQVDRQKVTKAPEQKVATVSMLDVAPPMAMNTGVIARNSKGDEAVSSMADLELEALPKA